ncbi:hypothetical protein PISMIDRAFT_587023 [Pisolithus microcarpus 441]|uniref:methylated diphthine methylhydrolase n=1 Tax=Pisolithus microcarpus 441 TaxID=765257 RepID=A0A0D0A9F1_9AGAM|nr:hypothetical protein PISMIDRAFT_587023 [Pisolithus microcarpus 441]
MAASQSYDTVLPADSVEFCPHEGSRDIFVCGTYMLEQQQDVDVATNPNEPLSESERSQNRWGRCLVFKVTDTKAKLCTLVQEMTSPAVLDQKWCHRSRTSTAVLGIADSEGNISVQEWQPQNHRFRRLQNIPCLSGDVLCLSLDWSNRRYPSDHLGSLIVSLSDGSLCLLNPSSSDGLVVSNVWRAHDYEPWIAAWNYWESSVVYSGGDDLSLKAWDIRQPLHRPVFANRSFDAGVTSIQNHPYIEHLLAVGSYDNAVRLFDTRNPLSPLTTIDVGGGAWRVKWHPSPERKNDLLVACMHDGFKIVNIDCKEYTMPYDIGKCFRQHESLAYGVDWSFHEDVREKETLIASCSFYDHKLCLWSG